MRRGLALFATVLLLGTLAASFAEVAWAQFPPFPTLYRGDVTVGGQPAPDGLAIVARITDYGGLPTWESPTVTTSNGRYLNLKVGPTDRAYLGATVTFHADGVQAAETVQFIDRGIFTEVTLDLTFPAIVPTPTPTPIPTATPEPTATPGPTATPTPTAVPTATATPAPTPTALLPVPGDPSVPMIPPAAGAVGALLVLVGGGALHLMRRPHRWGSRP